MKAIGRYDATLQMFVETPQPLDYRKLSFLRALAEAGKLEHDVAGDPAGCVLETGSAVTQALTDGEKLAILGRARAGVFLYAVPDPLLLRQD